MRDILKPVSSTPYQELTISLDSLSVPMEDQGRQVAAFYRAVLQKVLSKCGIEASKPDPDGGYLSQLLEKEVVIQEIDSINEPHLNGLYVYQKLRDGHSAPDWQPIAWISPPFEVVGTGRITAKIQMFREGYEFQAGELKIEVY